MKISDPGRAVGGFRELRLVESGPKSPPPFRFQLQYDPNDFRWRLGGELYCVSVSRKQVNRYLQGQMRPNRVKFSRWVSLDLPERVKIWPKEVNSGIPLDSERTKPKPSLNLSPSALCQLEAKWHGGWHPHVLTRMGKWHVRARVNPISGRVLATPISGRGLFTIFPWYLEI